MLLEHMVLAMNIFRRVIALDLMSMVYSSHERSVMLLEHMVSAMNVFLRVIAPDSRTQICKLGEEIFANILYLWHNIASEELKVIILTHIK